MVGWRNSKLFIYGWLPIRILAIGIAFTAAIIFAAAMTLLWLQPSQFRRSLDAALGGY